MIVDRKIGRSIFDRMHPNITYMVKHNDEELKLSNFVDDTTIHNDNGSKLFWSSNLYRKVQSANVPLHCRGRLQLGRSCETKSLKSC